MLSNESSFSSDSPFASPTNSARGALSGVSEPFAASGLFGVMGALLVLVRWLVTGAVVYAFAAAAPARAQPAGVAATAPAPETSAAPARVRGVVVDAETGAPIPGAVVYAITTSATEETLTAADGSFALTSSAITGVTVLSDFHQPATVPISAARRLAVRVRMTPLGVGEAAAEIIAIEGERPAAAPGATTVRRAEITRIPGSRGDALTGLKNLPGIANNGSLTPSSGGLIIRGSSPEDSRILVDGFEIPILYHFLGVQSVLPSEMLDDVEYLPGAYGPAFGRASGGIVSVTSRRGAEQPGGFVELSFVNAAGLVEGPLGKRGSFAVAARRSVIDAILPAVIPDDANLSFTAYPRYYDYQAQAEYRVTESWQLTGFLFGSSDEVELVSDNDNAGDPVATGRFASDASFTRAIAAAHYRAPAFTAKLAASAYTDTNHFSVGADRYLRLDRDGVAGRAELAFRPNRALRLTAGGEADLTRVRFDLKFSRPPREGDPMQPNFSEDALLFDKGSITNPDLGAWANAQLSPVPALQLDVGLRADAFVRNSDVVLQPRAQASWNVVEGSTLRAAAGRYSRPPEDLDEGLQDELQAELATHFTAGVEQRLSLTPGRAGPSGTTLTVTATAFHNRLEELVVLGGSRRDMADFAGYVNRGEGRAWGAELMLRLRRDDFFGWLAYTGARATRRDDPDGAADSLGRRQRLFDYDQAHNVVAVASWTINDDWTLGGRFQLTTGKPYTPVEEAVYQADRDSYLPRYGEVNSRRVDTQHQLDLRLDRVWRFRSWKLSGYLDIANTYLNAAVVDYSYNFDYSSRSKITTLPIIPSIGLRGEM
jgi:TonB-dependent Receptor Plug Domain